MMEEFTKNDWDNMHDCVLDLTNKQPTQEQLIIIFDELPDELKEEAYEWGMNDTLWRDKFIQWYGRNK